MFIKALKGLFKPKQTEKTFFVEPRKGMEGSVHYDEKKCEKGYLCVKNCPTNAIRVRKDGFIEIDSEKCIRCAICTENCPTKALVMEKNPIKGNK